MAYQSSLSPDCWNRAGFANCMTPQYVIASQYCEKQGTLTDECVGKMADELGKTACNCGATPTPTQTITGNASFAAIPSWAYVLAGGALLYYFMSRRAK